MTASRHRKWGRSLWEGVSLVSVSVSACLGCAAGCGIMVQKPVVRSMTCTFCRWTGLQSNQADVTVLHHLYTAAPAACAASAHHTPHSMFIHPKTQKQYAAAFDAAVAGLKYGAITINCPSTAAFSTTAIVWGAYPGGQGPQPWG